MGEFFKEEVAPWIMITVFNPLFWFLIWFIYYLWEGWNKKQE